MKQKNSADPPSVPDEVKEKGPRVIDTLSPELQETYAKLRTSSDRLGTAIGAIAIAGGITVLVLMIRALMSSGMAKIDFFTWIGAVIWIFIALVVLMAVWFSAFVSGIAAFMLSYLGFGRLAEIGLRIDPVHRRELQEYANNIGVIMGKDMYGDGSHIGPDLFELPMQEVTELLDRKMFALAKDVLVEEQKNKHGADLHDARVRLTQYSEQVSKLSKPWDPYFREASQGLLKEASEVTEAANMQMPAFVH